MGAQQKLIPIGEGFGRLTVIRRDGHMYTCRCSCGTEIVRRRRHLINDKVLSCGCIKRENARALLARIVHLHRRRTYSKYVDRIVFWREIGGLTWAAIGRVIAKERGLDHPLSPTHMCMVYGRHKKRERRNNDRYSRGLGAQVQRDGERAWQ